MEDDANAKVRRVRIGVLIVGVWSLLMCGILHILVHPNNPWLVVLGAGVGTVLILVASISGALRPATDYSERRSGPTLTFLRNDFEAAEESVPDGSS